MNKIVKNGLLCLAAVTLFTGCEKETTKEEKGAYKEGTYFASVKAPSYGTDYYTTAVVYVGEDGKIKSVFLDNTYKGTDNSYTTKKTLGDAYGMKSTSAKGGKIEGGAEWYEQAKVIEDKVVETQNLDWVKWSDDAKTKLDGVSGCTIAANTYVEAIDDCLKQAK